MKLTAYVALISWLRLVVSIQLPFGLTSPTLTCFWHICLLQRVNMTYSDIHIVRPGVSNTRPAWYGCAARVIIKTIKYDWNYSFCYGTFYPLLRPAETYFHHYAARELIFFCQNVALEWIWVWHPWVRQTESLHFLRVSCDGHFAIN